MSKEFNLYEGWKRDHKSDMPALHTAKDNLKTGEVVILQQIGFTTPSGAEVQVSYERAIELGLIDASEDRWSMSNEQYLYENNE